MNPLQFGFPAYEPPTYQDFLSLGYRLVNLCDAVNVEHLTKFISEAEKRKFDPFLINELRFLEGVTRQYDEHLKKEEHVRRDLLKTEIIEEEKK